MTIADSWAHPVDLLLREVDRLKGDPGGTDVINMTAAIVNLAREQGTVLGAVPPDELANLWTFAVRHRMALERHGYFEHHPRAFTS